MRVASKRKWSDRWTPAAIMALRQRLGVTQEAFAHLVNSTTSNVNRWERGIHAPHPLYLAEFDRLRRNEMPHDDPDSGELRTWFADRLRAYARELEILLEAEESAGCQIASGFRELADRMRRRADELAAA